jgi:hypothetical protein
MLSKELISNYSTILILLIFARVDSYLPWILNLYSFQESQKSAENLEAQTNPNDFLINSIIFGLIDSSSNFITNAILRKYNAFKVNLISLFLSICFYIIKVVNVQYFGNDRFLSLSLTYIQTVLIQIKCGAFFVIFDEMIPK